MEGRKRKREKSDCGEGAVKECVIMVKLSKL